MRRSGRTKTKFLNAECRYLACMDSLNELKTNNKRRLQTPLNTIVELDEAHPVINGKVRKSKRKQEVKKDEQKLVDAVKRTLLLKHFDSSTTIFSTIGECEKLLDR